MVCRAVRAKLFRYLDEELAPAERTALERHVTACSECRCLLDLERTFRHTHIVPLQVEAAPEEVRAQVVRFLNALPGRPSTSWERRVFRCSLAAGIAIIFLGGLLWFGLQQLWTGMTSPLIQLAEAAVEQHQKLARAVLPYDITQVSPKVAEEWFRHRLDFSLSIPELGDENIVFRGEESRICKISKQQPCIIRWRARTSRCSSCRSKDSSSWGSRIPRNLRSRLTGDMTSSPGPPAD
jgi:anti-sigma factor (TIGR02949 family)